MVFTAPVLYIAFTSSEIVKIFLDNLIVLVYLDNNPEIYFNNFFVVARKNEKNIKPGHMLPFISKLGHMPQLMKSTELGKSVKIKQNTPEGKTKDGVIRTPTLWANFKV